MHKEGSFCRQGMLCPFRQKLPFFLEEPAYPGFHGSIQAAEWLWRDFGNHGAGSKEALDVYVEIPYP